MDLVLEILDNYVFDYVYAKALPRNGLVESYLEKLVQKTANSTISAPHSIGGFSNSTAISDIGAAISSAASQAVTHSTALRFVSELCSKMFTQNVQDIYGPPSPVLNLTPGEYYGASFLPRESLVRLSISLFFVIWIFGYVLYAGTAGLQYYFVYDPINFSHPRFLKNQIKLELKQSFSAIPIMSLLTVPWFVLELQGYSKLYWNIEDHGWTYFVLQFPLFLMFTDCLIYVIHRGLHHPLIYSRLHKPHHKWVVPTPFASHAFHPLDGYSQSLPYHMFPFLFPLQKGAYMLLFTLVNVWSVTIHDGQFLSNNPVVNGSACHTLHHLYFNYNYGQYTTLWDRLGGSYRVPDQEMYDKNMRMAQKTLDKQLAEFEQIRDQVEGSINDRVYFTDEKGDFKEKKQNRWGKAPRVKV